MNDSVKRQVAEPDTDTVAWWDGTRRRRLLVQRCGVCGNAQHYPRSLCTACGADDLDMEPAIGTGIVETFTVVHRAVYEGLDPPYVVALVRLTEGPLLLTNVVGIPPGLMHCGLSVAVRWEPLEDGRNLPVFAPDGKEQPWTSG